jgi:preprotein translocase subunit SecB
LVGPQEARLKEIPMFCQHCGTPVPDGASTCPRFFLIKNLDDASMSHTLGAFCPNILFPYARETLDSLVVRGSFPALMLAPVNFDALYAQELQRIQQQAAEAAPAH